MSGFVATARVAGSWHISRFAVVGATCAGLQFVFNALLRTIGAPDIAAFVVSFVLSAQVNFLLSDRFTWGSRRSEAEWSVPRRWLGYNLSTLLALILSSTVFSVAAQFVDNALAVLAGIAGGSILTFLVGDRLVFAPRRGRHRAGDPLLVTAVSTIGADGARGSAAVGPFVGVDQIGASATGTGGPGTGPDRIRGTRHTALDEIPPDRLSRMLGRGIAVFLPCYNEAANLPAVVATTVVVLRDIGVPFQVIIVNDGSQDDTERVARALCETYGGQVALVSHEKNRGYGDALRTGFAAGLAGGWDWVGFLDSDNQFDSEEIKNLIATAYYEHVDLVAGYRIKRADGFLRRLNGKLWHLLSRLVVGIREKDVDCGFKLVHRNVLESIDLRSSYAAVSPELLAKTRRAGFRSAEVGVHHYPRMAGEQTGADLKVVLNSLISLVRLRLAMSRSAGGSSDGKRSDPGDRPAGLPSAAGIGWLAALLSITAYLTFALRAETLLYDDSISHLIISRRLLDSTTPGLAQLGSVWLPLPHLLVQPGIWIDAAYYSGLVGSLLSMVSFVVATVYLFKTAYLMTTSVVGAWIAGLLFALNPNILYLQSTPMTETLLFACIAGAIYQLQRWSQTQRWQNLAGASLWIFLASLTRYEGWVLLAGFVVVVLFIQVRRRYGRDHMLAGLVFFGALGAAGVAGWLLWNRAIFGSFTDFATGQFAKSSLWVGTTDVAVGDLPISLRTYLSASSGTVGLPLAVLGMAGLVLYLVRGRLRADRVAPLGLLIFFPFFVVALYTGQRPLHVLEITGDLYNTRFGVVMLIPSVLFAAYLSVAVGRWARDRHRAFGAGGGSAPDAEPSTARRLSRPALVAGVAVLTAIGMVISGGVLTLQEPRAWSGNRDQLAPAIAAISNQYDGGPILMQGFGNEYVTFASRVPADETIYEGSYLLWAPALDDPLGSGIDWIYFSRTPTDQVWQAMQANPQMASYQPVFDDGMRALYRRG